MAGNNITPWIGVYGAVLSTVLAILQWRRDRGKFSVKPEVLHITPPINETTIVWYLIEIVNTGRRTLYLDDFGFTRVGGEDISMRDRERGTEFPLKLERVFYPAPLISCMA